MKNRFSRRLKQILQDAAHHAGVNYRVYCDNFPIVEFFDAVEDDDDARTIAIDALLRWCTEATGFNNNTVGLKAVLQFLAETEPAQPMLDQDVAACLADLRETLDSASPTFNSISEWLDRWYQV